MLSPLRRLTEKELTEVPLKNGALTAQEQAVARAMAATGSQSYARAEARVSQPNLSRTLARPAVQAEIARIQTERLFTEALPAAVQCLVDIIRSDKAPAGARVQAAKVVMDRTLGSDEAANAKAPSEMTPDELAREIDKLQALAMAKAKPLNATIEPDTSLFD